MIFNSFKYRDTISIIFVPDTRRKNIAKTAEINMLTSIRKIISYQGGWMTDIEETEVCVWGEGCG